LSTPNPQDLTEAIRAALAAGNKIAAIKLYREQTGLGLAEAKQAVERMESQFRQSAAPDVTLPPTNPPSRNQAGAIKEAILAGEKITAIKLYRAQYTTGLAETKRAVEEMEAQLRLASPELFTRPPASKGCLVLVPLLALVGAATWKLLA
jgi:ribosomal protein L7/L12